MKKILLSTLAFILVACTALAGACSDSVSWTKPTLNNPGEVISAGGFLAETENYIYVINGNGGSTSDNRFGAPVKGSLIAIEKSTVGTDNVNAQIVVPKLFAASDYGAGLYIYGGYVYYGSPSTDKDSSGNIATNELVFMRTKLDGSQDKAETFFSVSSLSAQYRITEKDGVVYIIYQDPSDSSVRVYNTSSKTDKLIAETDAENNEPIAEGKNAYASLNAVTFADNGDLASAALFYTVTVYDEKYYEDKASQEGYSRSTASYNIVYAVNAAGEAVKVLDGEAESLTYAITLVEGGYVFYTATPVSGTAKTYAKSVADIFDSNAAAEEIKNTTYAASGVVINSLEEVYYWDSENKKLIKSTLTGSETTVKQTVLKSETLSTLLFVKNGYVYYLNSNGELARAELNNADAKEQRVSQGAVGGASSWYLPETASVGGKDYLFYLDTSTAGSSYVWYADLSSTVVSEDTDDNDEDDLFYFEKTAPAAVMTDADRANIAVAAIDAIESELDWEIVEGKFTVASVEKANEIYNALPAEVKENVGESYVNKLENCNRAIKLGEKYYALKGVANYEKLSEDEQKAYKAAYEAAKAERRSLIDALGSDGYITVRDYLGVELKSYYSSANSIFEEEE